MPMMNIWPILEMTMNWPAFSAIGTVLAAFGAFFAAGVALWVENRSSRRNSDRETRDARVLGFAIIRELYALDEFDKLTDISVKFPGESNQNVYRQALGFIANYEAPILESSISSIGFYDDSFAGLAHEPFLALASSLVHFQCARREPAGLV